MDIISYNEMPLKPFHIHKEKPLQVGNFFQVFDMRKKDTNEGDNMYCIVKTQRTAL